MSNPQDNEQGRTHGSDPLQEGETAENSLNSQIKSISGAGSRSDSIRIPEQATSIETSQILESDVADSRRILIVPIEFPQTGESRQGSDKAATGGKEKDEKQGSGSRSRKEDRGDSSKNNGSKSYRSQWLSKSPSLVRTLLFPAVVSLVCGVLGAWGYSHFFGTDKSSDKQTSSGGSNSGGQSKSGGQGSNQDQGSKGNGSGDMG